MKINIDLKIGGDGSSKLLSFGAANFLSGVSGSRLFQRHRPKKSANEIDGGVRQTGHP